MEINKDIFDLESAMPPKIKKSELKAEAKRKELKVQSAVLLVGAVLFAIAVTVLGIFFLRYSEAMAVILFISAAYILLGGGGIMYIFLCRGAQILTVRKTYTVKGE